MEIRKFVRELQLADLVADPLPQVLVPGGRRPEVDHGVVLLREARPAETHGEIRVLVQHARRHPLR
jgi:hypothetical protein